MSDWHRACALDDIEPDTGVCVLHNGQQVAVFRVGDSVYAIGNRDPYSGANVLSRGLVGDSPLGPRVASPMYKHSFLLGSGQSVDDPSICVPCYCTRLVDGVIDIAKLPVRNWEENSAA